ncbi:glycosyltransferase family 4 protein [Flagellimonas algicola]|uniref:Glycosyltransferase family 4 protein n=1 Tax=Flagellimonas algicola TaxID=2583815 RepID=A0ABY2WJN3_9FLAO|nr:glycosyltransferase family 4 protein [Allomuricauda algicola]TMU55047.1 glycosyltransferase family 4 protein [Allomuricauda algicola]
MKQVWIINQYITSPDIEGDGYRHYYVAKELAEKGYDTTLITSSFSHAPYRHTKIKGLYKLVNKDVRTLVLKGNKYGKSQGLGRIISWIVFVIQLMCLPLISRNKIPRPDIIVLSSLPLLPILNVILFKALFYRKVKIVFEIRDLWPLSAIELGNYSKRNAFIGFLSYLEKKAYQNADFIISVIPRADIHIKEVLTHEKFKFRWITNGFKIPSSSRKLELSDVCDTSINTNDFNIGYAGTLVVANPLDTIIQVVGNHENKQINLFILGGGPEKERIVKLGKDYPNIHVLDRIPKKYVQSFLSQMDLLFMGKGTKNTTIYKFGTSQLKTFDYFFAKKPIIQALNSSENPVTYSNSGYVVEPENDVELKEKIDYFIGMGKDGRNSYGNRGYEYLIANCTYKIIGERFAEVFDELMT